MPSAVVIVAAAAWQRSLSARLTSGFCCRSEGDATRGSSQPSTPNALHIPKKSAFAVGVATAQPSSKRNGRAPAEKLAGCEPSPSSRVSLPAPSTQKYDTTASSIDRCTC